MWDAALASGRNRDIQARYGLTLRGRKKNISPLVAARVRPIRQAPGGSAFGSPAWSLSLNRVGKSGDAAHLSQAADENISAREEVRHSATALHVTEAALGKMSDLLTALSRVVEEASGLHRKPPGSAKALQGAIDSTLDAIDAVVDRVEFGGRKLLEEDWPETFEGAVLHGESVSDENAEVSLPDVDTRRFHGGPGGFLAALRSGGAKSVAVVGLEEILEVIQASISALSEQRDQLATFLNTQVRPVIEALEVASENVSAAENVLDDADFALQAGRMTGADVLLNAKPLQQLKTSPPAFFRMSEFAAENSSHQD